jgi:hypothetical protein
VACPLDAGPTTTSVAGELRAAAAAAYKAKIDAELNVGTFVAGSKTTFGENAAHWIETLQLVADSRLLPVDAQRAPRAVLRLQSAVASAVRSAVGSA